MGIQNFKLGTSNDKFAIYHTFSKIHEIINPRKSTHDINVFAIIYTRLSQVKCFIC